MQYKVASVLALLAVLAPVKAAPTTLYARHDGYDDNSTYSSGSVSATPAPTTSAAAPNATGAAAEFPFWAPNALDAQKLNAGFKLINANDTCATGQSGCLSSQVAECVGGKWNLSQCATPDLECFALPKQLSNGTVIACVPQDDALERFAAAGVTGGTDGSATNTTVPATRAQGGNNDDCDDGTADDGATGGDDDCDDGGDGTAGGNNGTADGADDCSGEDAADGKDAPATTIALGTATTVKQATPTPSPSTTLAPAANNQNKTGNSVPTITLVAAPSQASPTGPPSENPASTITLVAAPAQATPSSSPSSAQASPSPSAAPYGAGGYNYRRQVTTLNPSSASSTPSVPATASPSVVTPTVVIGTDGIVTVTLVSTVTVSATGCSVAPVPTGVPISVTPAIPTVATLSPVTPVLLPSASTSSSSTPTVTPTPAGGFTFSFSTQPTPTPTPNGTGSNAGNLSELLTATV